MHAACVLPGGKQPGPCCTAIGLEDHAPHHVVRGGNHLYQASGQIEATVRTTLHHALELLTHIVCAKMLHLDVYTAMRRRAAGTHLRENASRDNIARGPLATRVHVV